MRTVVLCAVALILTLAIWAVGRSNPNEAEAMTLTERLLLSSQEKTQEAGVLIRAAAVPSAAGRTEAASAARSESARRDAARLEAQGEAYAEIAQRVDAMVQAAYAPVYASIPAYGAFHYSLPGQYAQILGSGRGVKALSGRMLQGFEERVQPMTEALSVAALPLLRGSARGGGAASASQASELEGGILQAVGRDAAKMSAMARQDAVGRWWRAVWTGLAVSVLIALVVLGGDAGGEAFGAFLLALLFIGAGLHYARILNAERTQRVHFEAELRSVVDESRDRTKGQVEAELRKAWTAAAMKTEPAERFRMRDLMTPAE